MKEKILLNLKLAVLLLLTISFGTFRSNAQTKLTSENLIGTTTSWGSNDPIDLSVAFDGDFSTFIDTWSNWGFVGYDFGTSGAMVDTFKYAPRTGYAYRMNGAVLRGSNSSDFLNNFDVLYTISSDPTDGVLTGVSIASTTSYRYIYLFMGSDTYSNISQFSLLDADENELSGTIIGQELGSSWCSSCTPANAFDGSFDTYVEGPTTIGFVGYDFGEGNEVTLTSWKYAPRTAYPARMVGTELRGSNSPDYLSNYTVLHTITAQPSTEVLTEGIITDENAYRYVYWKGNADSYGDISEMELYYSEVSPDATLSGITLSTGTLTPSFDAGITSYGVTIPSGTESVEVTPTKSNDNASIISGGGTVNITDGIGSTDILVQAEDGTTQLTYTITFKEECFVQYYPEATNIVADPTVSDISNFSGWGTLSINIDDDYTYCGATSGTVGDNCGGSFNYVMNENIVANTTYQVRAMIYATTNQFNLGIYNGDASPFAYQTSETGTWEQMDVLFTTGDSPSTSDCGFYFNACESAAGTGGYIDNWEIYDVTDATLSALTGDDISVPDFAPGTLTYTYSVPVGTSAPTVDATPTNESASILINQASEVPGTATVTVTGFDGIELTYTINFEEYVITENKLVNASTIEIYPTVTSGEFNVKFSGELGTIQVLDLSGKQVLNKKATQSVETISVPNSGIYFIKVSIEGQSKISKVIKLD